MRGNRENVRVDLWPSERRSDKPRRRWRRGLLRCTLGGATLAAVAYATTPAGEAFMYRHNLLAGFGDLAIIGICVVLAIGANQ